MNRYHRFVDKIRGIWKRSIVAILIAFTIIMATAMIADLRWRTLVIVGVISLLVSGLKLVELGEDR